MGSSEKKKRKHVCLTILEKVKLLEQFDRGVSVKRLIEEFGVGKTTIFRNSENPEKLPTPGPKQFG